MLVGLAGAHDVDGHVAETLPSDDTLDRISAALHRTIIAISQSEPAPIFSNGRP
jgi:hypothetical protein